MAVLLACFSLLGSVHAELVANGGFESPGAEGAYPDNWTADFNSYGSHTGTSAAHSGAWFWHPGASASAGGGYQDLTTAIGDIYTVSLWIQNWSAGAGSSHVRVLLGDAGTDTIAIDDTGGSASVFASAGIVANELHAITDGTVWQQVTFQFIATATTTRLGIYNANMSGDTYHSINVDDVSVIPDDWWWGARDPVPAHGATGVTRSQILRWTAGTGAPQAIDYHYVYFGADSAAIAAATKGDPSQVATLPVGTTEYAPVLAANTTYYWRVDEVIEPDRDPNHVEKGVVWRFETPEIICARYPISDVNKDCKVDLSDIALLAVEWLTDNMTEVRDRWDAQTAWNWYAQVGPITGCNYVPRTAVNTTEMWQADTFDPITIDQELGWARQCGINSVRVFVQYIVYQEDAQGLLERLDRFLAIADSHGISTTLVLLDDCFGPEPSPGPQPDPIPGVHNSRWTSSPGEFRKQEIFRPNLKEYVTEIIYRYKNDSRILMWDLYNEAQSSSRPLLEQVFKWARAVNPSQPLTSCWQASDLWDVASFHDYNPPNESYLSGINAERPAINTECIARTRGSVFSTVLPAYANHGIGWYMWGLVKGRIQTYYPWGSPQGAPEPEVWFHDLLHPDGTPYDPAEITLIQNFPNVYVPPTP